RQQAQRYARLLRSATSPKWPDPYHHLAHAAERALRTERSLDPSGGRHQNHMSDQPSHKHRGVVPPMITPFTPDGAIDVPAVRRVIDHLIAGSASGIFVLGTTGEAASIPTDEK